MANKRPEIMITSGPMSGRRFAVGEGGLRLGRSSANDVCVPDEELSRNHCLFECEGEAGLRILDLASANGTFVNDVQLGSDPRILVPGDVIVVGGTTITVVGERPPEPRPASKPGPVAGAAPAPVQVDLGLGGGPGARESAPVAAPRRSPLANVLWAVAVVFICTAIGLILFLPNGTSPQSPLTPPVEEKKAALSSVGYEKVEATASRIFRYEVTVDAAGVLHAVLDDVPGENRHVDKSVKLSPAAFAGIAEIFDANREWNDLDAAYVGASADDENALNRVRIRLVRGETVKDVVVENSPEPDAFRAVRERLETFSKNELGIWAIQYSRDKLVELSAESARAADAKWEEREVEYGNLAGAIRAYREAVSYLETVNPKPEGYAELKEKLRKAEAELDERYRAQRFSADQQINLGDWARAQEELRILCDLVPDKADARHQEANAKLVDVEKRMKKGGSR